MMMPDMVNIEVQVFDTRHDDPRNKKLRTLYIYNKLVNYFPYKNEIYVDFLVAHKTRTIFKLITTSNDTIFTSLEHSNH